jgi:hypothetical protein
MDHRQIRSHDMDQSPARSTRRMLPHALTWINGFLRQEAQIAHITPDSRCRRVT